MAKTKSSLAISGSGGVTVIGGGEMNLTAEQARNERTLARRLASSGSAQKAIKGRLAEIEMALSKTPPTDKDGRAEFFERFYDLTQEKLFLSEKMKVAKDLQKNTQVQLNFVYEQAMKEENPDVNIVEVYARALPDAPKKLPKGGKK